MDNTPKRLKKEVSLIEFLKAVKKCEGTVSFETDEGDKLVLDSALSQYIFCSLANEPEAIDGGYVTCTNVADLELLRHFFRE